MNALQKGVYTAVLTPQDKNLQPDIDRLVSHCGWLLDNGCSGVALFGTTGEANSFPVELRISALDKLTAAGFDAKKILLGTGACAVEDAVRLARHGLDHGIHNVLMLPPFYYKNVPEDGVFDFFASFLDQIADPGLNIYLYHFPKMSGIPFSHDLIGRLLGAFPDNIAGIKDSGGEYTNMTAMIEKFPGFAVFSGSERYLYQILNAGGQGCISATANVTCRIAGQIYQKWLANEDAAHQQAILTVFRTVFEKYPLIPALKEIMAWRTGDDSWLNMRPPQVRLSPADAADLTAALSNSGLFDNMD